MFNLIPEETGKMLQSVQRGSKEQIYPYISNAEVTGPREAKLASSLVEEPIDLYQVEFAGL